MDRTDYSILNRARGARVCPPRPDPQSVHQLGGYKVQGKTVEAAEQLKADALNCKAAGAAILVLETIPAPLAKEVTELLHIPTIGIGAGLTARDGCW